MLDFLKKTHPWKKFETKTDEDEDRIIAGLHLSKFLVFLTYPTIVKLKLPKMYSKAMKRFLA